MEAVPLWYGKLANLPSQRNWTDVQKLKCCTLHFPFLEMRRRRRRRRT